MLRRRRCPDDARVVRLELTAAGQRLCREIPYGLSRVLNGLLRGFTEDELATFKTMVLRMLANAGASDSAASARPSLMVFIVISGW